MSSIEIRTINQAPTVCQCELLYIHLVLTYHQKVEIGAHILQTRKTEVHGGELN